MTLHSFVRALSFPRPEAEIEMKMGHLLHRAREGNCFINIDLRTILLEDLIPVEWGNVQGDFLMVKFDICDIQNMLAPGIYNLKVIGEPTDEIVFEGYSDVVRIIELRQTKMWNVQIPQARESSTRLWDLRISRES